MSPFRTARGHRTAVAVGVLLILAGAIPVSLLGKVFAEEQPPPPPAPPAVAGAPDRPPPPDGSLSPADERAAAAIAEAHSAVQAVLSRVDESKLVVPWTKLESEERLGAGVEYTWDTPIDVSGRWPTLFYDETEMLSPPYQTTTALVEAKNVRGIHVSVDLAAAKVVGMHPVPDAVITKLEVDPGFERKLPPQPQNPR